jgi:hypothetical protein
MERRKASPSVGDNIMSNPKKLFITGMFRSGTTLLEKLINTHHPSSSILYQPCMPLFTGVKNAFFTSIGYESKRYPLGSLFCEFRYKLQDFEAFLEQYRPLKWPNFPKKLKNEKERYEGGFAKILPQIWRDLEAISSVNLLGAKEVLCEEFTPYLANNGFKIVFIIRDPRDVITSMNYGKGSQHVGAIRPTLYNLRNWRKSVAFALYLSDLGQAIYVRYEDLVKKPENCLSWILSWIDTDIKEFKLDSKSQLIDYYGQNWAGNSSFDAFTMISDKSMGRYNELLPQILIEYIEAVCWPEMHILGYPTNNIKNFDEAVKAINSFTEPLEVDHVALPADYSSNPNNISQENRRAKLLISNDYVRDSERKYFFIFSDVFKLLWEKCAKKWNL